MPRTYFHKKEVAATPKPKIDQEREIPSSARLYDLKEASEELTKQFGKGYSDRAIRRLINSGEWQENWHYVRLRGRIIKIYLPAVQEWQVKGNQAG